jgi:hypothetical protein
VVGAPEEGGTKLPLGVDDESPYEQFAIPRGRGDLVVIYTDRRPDRGERPRGAYARRAGAAGGRARAGPGDEVSVAVPELAARLAVARERDPGTPSESVRPCSTASPATAPVGSKDAHLCDAERR